MNSFWTGQGPCHANVHKWGLTQLPWRDCGQRQALNHIVDTCPLTKFEGGLNLLHETDDDAATWLESSRVWTFVVGAELAVQSQQRRWDDGTRHPQLQPALSSAGTDKWVLSWRLNEASDWNLQLLEPWARMDNLLYITNSVIGVSRPLVLDCGMTFHLDSGGRDLPWTLSDNLWKLTYLATEALNDSFLNL